MFLTDLSIHYEIVLSITIWMQILSLSLSLSFFERKNQEHKAQTKHRHTNDNLAALFMSLLIGIASAGSRPHTSSKTRYSRSTKHRPSLVIQIVNIREQIQKQQKKDAQHRHKQHTRRPCTNDSQARAGSADLAQILIKPDQARRGQIRKPAWSGQITQNKETMYKTLQAPLLWARI